MYKDLFCLHFQDSNLKKHKLWHTKFLFFMTTIPFYFPLHPATLCVCMSVCVCVCICVVGWVKTVKGSRNRPSMAQRVPAGLGSQILWQSVSPTGHLHPQECSWYSFSRGAELILGLWNGRKKICHWKIQWHPGNQSQDCPTSSAAP